MQNSIPIPLTAFPFPSLRSIEESRTNYKLALKADIHETVADQPSTTYRTTLYGWLLEVRRAWKNVDTESVLSKSRRNIHPRDLCSSSCRFIEYLPDQCIEYSRLAIDLESSVMRVVVAVEATMHTGCCISRNIYLSLFEGNKFLLNKIPLLFWPIFQVVHETLYSRYIKQ